MNESTILGIQFSILSPEDIRKSSVAEITNKETYVNNKAVVNGLFDTRMGVLDPGLICPTDGLDYIQSPGYFGHLELARPVFYIQYLDTVERIAQCICIKCSQLLIDKTKYRSLLTLSAGKRWSQVHSLCHKITRCGESSVSGCGCLQPHPCSFDSPQRDILWQRLCTCFHRRSLDNDNKEEYFFLSSNSLLHLIQIH